jgi:AcrR family transcriptional regulator
MTTPRTTDRRVQKTDALLRNALAELVREKPYDDIALKEILHRANVGRSTFYTHYSDKDELLRSCIEEILRPARGAVGERGNGRPHERLLWFGLPVLLHIERHGGGAGLETAPDGQALHQHLREAIAELIEPDIRAALRGSRRADAYPAPDLLVAWVTSTFVMVLNWWLDGARALPAREVDRLFRSLVEPSLAAALE